MGTRVDQILGERKAALGSARRWGVLASSALLHILIALGFFFGPTLFARPTERIEYVPVILIPATMLGQEAPLPEPTPPEPKPEPAPPPPPPPPPEPKPEPKVSKLPPPAKPPAKDVPVLAEKKKKKTATPKAKPPPPKPPPPAGPLPLPRRKGTAEGNPLGISTTGANLGVEDPSFTYDYYIERVRASISEHWVRPPVGGGQVETLIYFRVAGDGKIFQQRILEGSGTQVFDKAAMRAVANASPLPPLPKSYKKDYLGITVVVR